LSLFLLASPAAAAEGPVDTLKVFVRAADRPERKDVDDATKQQLKAKKDEAKEARKALEQKLKDEHGKKEETWPPDKQDLLFEARENEAIARADYEYRKIEKKGLNDAVKDLVKSIQGKGLAGVKEHAQLVGSAGEADLVVEVLARRGEKTLPTQFKPDWCYLLFTIGAGGEMKPDRFAKIPANYRFRSWKHPAWKLRSPKPDEPWFYFESRNGGLESVGCHGDAANTASAVLNKFIEDNYKLLRGR
jgi:hypothetical protein